jgi:predicted component of type VI protein secretion system
VTAVYFKYDARLGIRLPDFPVDYEDLSLEEQEHVLAEWETIRSAIPDQILKFEAKIEQLLEEIHQEDDWDTIALHFDQIADYASRIHDLNTWRRVDPSLTVAALETAAEHRDREK